LKYTLTALLIEEDVRKKTDISEYMVTLITRYTFSQDFLSPKGKLMTVVQTWRELNFAFTSWLIGTFDLKMSFSRVNLSL